jgi:hypothetical protein
MLSTVVDASCNTSSISKQMYSVSKLVTDCIHARDCNSSTLVLDIVKVTTCSTALQ